MKAEAPALSQHTTVNDAIQQVPASVAIFKRAGIDSCCGGALSIAEAARRHQLDVDQLLLEIRRAAQA